MRTHQLVLDSDQGIGTPNQFTVTLNDSIKGCVHSQLRQVILTDMAPAADYVYIRSGKLGSNVLSSQGFGAFDVVPVNEPFQYERYTATPPRNEFECGRLLNSIDISIVNPDNTLVALKNSVRISNGNVLNLSYTSSYSDGSSGGDAIAVVVPTGDYTFDSLASAIQDVLEPSFVPPIQYRVTPLVSGINFAMDWTSLASEDTVVVSGGELFSEAGVTFSGISSLLQPVIMPAGNFSKKELCNAIVESLAPSLDAIKKVSLDAQYTASLINNAIVLNLKWVPLSPDTLLITNEEIFSNISISTTYTIQQPVVSASAPVKIPLGVYTRDNLVKVVKEALQFTAQAITDTYKHGDFIVVWNGDLLRIQLNWVCSSYNFYPVSAPLIDSVKLDITFDDGTTRSTSGTVGGSVIAGNTYYTETALLQAINNSLDNIAADIVATTDYDYATFSTSFEAGRLRISLDWQCSNYAELCVLVETMFSLTVANTRIFNPPQDPEFGGSFPVASNTYNYTIPAGSYTRSLLLANINSQSQGGITAQLESDGKITFSLSSTYMQTPFGSGIFQQVFDAFSINPINGDFTKLGLAAATAEPPSFTIIGNPTAYTSTLQISGAVLPTSIVSVVGTLHSNSNNYLNTTNTSLLSTQTTFLDNTFHQRSTWQFPNPATNILVDVTPTFTVSGDWTLAGSSEAVATPVQRVFTWDVMIPPNSVINPGVILTYNPASSLNSVVGLDGAPLTAVATSFGSSFLYKWTFPLPLSFPLLTGVSASISGTAEMGINGTVPGTKIVFNSNQRRFNWVLNPVASNHSKATVVVEITTV